MKEVMYIPGDLVINHHGTVLRIVDMAEGFLHTEYQDGSTELYISRKDVTPIPLTPTILEANGWEVSIIKDKRFWDRFSTEEEIQKDSFVDNSIMRIAVKNKIALMFWGSSPKVFIFELSHMVVRIEYCHQLQHLLFGLGLDSSLKV